ncbi:DUF6391 domain-containing protein [Ancylothrix sp. C2]|uniref:DUF6391 domain-containing protein n=1 Tax=Ancylothrix sp. D3o TaxID=2953691 RepID=UPI0021BAA95E|nr:DUF6391 domain-containing protein [Ancylothrix sp. D3o]MCT7949270.1 DUF6391 domain-containing protein [Ancylothrix sp. D3o]
MTTADQATPQASQSPFDFSPQPTLDAEFLKQLEFIPGFKELLMLRQVHALEHATVWVLSETQTPPTSPRISQSAVDNELLGGMSTDSGFYLYGNVSTTQLQRAVKTALHRITSGEWELAVHPRCGTNVSVGMLLTAGLALGIHLILPRGPIEQLIGLGFAASTAAQLAPDLGQLAQRYVTTAIPFNLAVENISQTRDIWGRQAHFVRIRWQNS